MTIHERMVPRSEREKDLLKYGRGQERERIIKLLDTVKGHSAMYDAVEGEPEMKTLVELIKGETK